MGQKDPVNRKIKMFKRIKKLLLAPFLLMFLTFFTPDEDLSKWISDLYKSEDAGF